VLCVEEIREIMAVLFAEIAELRRIARARADVTALDGDGAKPIEESVGNLRENPERAAASVMKDGAWARFAAYLEQALGGDIERLVPRDGHELALLSEERRRKTLRRILGLQEVRCPVAKKAPRDWVVGITPEAHDTAILHGGNDAARVGAIAVADRLAELLHDSECKPKMHAAPRRGLAHDAPL
jgi:hypothetical protein